MSQPGQPGFVSLRRPTLAPACQFDPGSKEIGVAIILLAGERPKALLSGLKNRHRRHVTANGRLTSFPGDAGLPSLQRAA